MESWISILFVGCTRMNFICELAAMEKGQFLGLSTADPFVNCPGFSRVFLSPFGFSTTKSANVFCFCKIGKSVDWMTSHIVDWLSLERKVGSFACHKWLSQRFWDIWVIKWAVIGNPIILDYWSGKQYNRILTNVDICVVNDYQL